MCSLHIYLYNVISLVLQHSVKCNYGYNSTAEFTNNESKIDVIITAHVGVWCESGQLCIY